LRSKLFILLRYEPAMKRKISLLVDISSSSI
jgi:hypothetical protein